jgi:hypothetical protein
MRMKAVRRLILIIVIGCFAGCADVARWTRQYTYPSDFRYIERDQLRSTMGQLARHVREIDEHMQTPTDPAQLRKDILEHLDGMDAAVRSLNATGWPSNHARIDMNLSRFQRDIRLARQGVEQEPPNYTLTYSVTGACVYCHDRR